MSEFRIANPSVFKMKGTNGRFYHLATIYSGVREYICMVDSLTQQCYIEEVTGGHLSFIEDDSLAIALAKFCEEKGVTDMRSVGARVRAALEER